MTFFKDYELGRDVALVVKLFKKSALEWVLDDVLR
jgi:hypothetical protein